MLAYGVATNAIDGYYKIIKSTTIKNMKQFVEQFERSSKVPICTNLLKLSLRDKWK